MSRCLRQLLSTALLASVPALTATVRLTAATCAPAPVGLVGWWPGEGNANDTISTNHGTLVGGATTGTGFVGAAFTFDGTNASVQIPDSPLFHPTNLTIETWVRFSSLDSAGSGGSPPGEQYIVFKQNSRSDSFEGFDLGKDRSGANDSFRFLVSSAGGQSAEIRSTTVVATGVWYHVAAVRGAGFTQLYVNGQLEHQTNVAFPLDYGTRPIFFGTSSQTYWDHKFKGTLDEVSLYNRALAANEIAAIYAAGSAGKCRGPIITLQPQSLTVVAGRDAAFSVTASGNPPLGYQWLFDSSSIAGATSANLTLNAVQATNAGNYLALVTNAGGTTTSAVAVLNVLIPPLVAVQPADRTNGLGTTASFSVVATGTAPLSYQWRFSGTNLVSTGRVSGANSNVLTITNVQTGDTGYYSLLVSNPAGLTPSALADLTVLVPPTITTPPQDLWIVAGTTASFHVAADGSAPLSYQWRRGGVDLVNGGSVSGANSSALSLINVQTNDSAQFQVVVTNLSGAVTSSLATLTVSPAPVPPSLTLLPSSQVVFAGSTVSLAAAAVGTMPLSYQWMKEHSNLSSTGNISGALGPVLALQNVQPGDAGGYQLFVTNSGGAVTSGVATLTVNLSAKTGADAAVLVNSTSANYLDFRHYVQPYLDHFGVPYSVLDIASNGLATDLSRYALLIVGHKLLDTNLNYLTSVAQAGISAAVSNGVGLVNFDSDLSSVGGVPRYQFLQEIFDFTYGSSATGTSVTFPATEAGAQMHYITARHNVGEFLALGGPMSLVGLTLSSNSTAIALSGGRPFLSVQKFGQGRAAQWSSYDWVAAAVQGPIAGLDDLVWRSLVWAARKPFVMRGMPNFVTARFDDVEGPLDWLHTVVNLGFKPWVGPFYANMSDAAAFELRALVTNGNATASIHSLTGGTFLYFDHDGLKDWPDTVISNKFYAGTQWQASHGIPYSKVIVAHYSELGVNALPFLKAWGIEYLTVKNDPGTPRDSPWLVAGPYRRYEPRQLGSVDLPLFYADFLTVAGHPEFDHQFFECVTEIRDAACNEWCPTPDVPSTIARGTLQLKRALDSLALPTLFTHEWRIHPTPSVPGGPTIGSNSWYTILQGITNNLAAYQPLFVTLDYACQYVRATRTARLVSADYDLNSGQVVAGFTGTSDLALTVSVFTGEGFAITANPGNVPAFFGATNVPVGTAIAAPVIRSQPASVISGVGLSASFLTGLTGTAPLVLQWCQNGLPLGNGGPVSGATNSLLVLAPLAPGQAGDYRLVATNLAGSATSSVATLTVVARPLITTITWLPDGAPSFAFQVQSNLSYRVDASADLISWEPLTNLSSPSDTAQFIDRGAASFLKRFYRVVWVP